MKFSHPPYLFLLWGVLPLIGLLVYGIRRHKKILSRFADPGMLPYILPGFTYTRKWIKACLVAAGLSLALVALAGPQAGFHWEKITQKGVDIMVALDCSRSMLAQDVPPTRLTRAKREIIDLTRLLHSDRAGLVAFSGQAMLQCPLTLDYPAFHIFLDALTPDYLPVGGTDLTAALMTCYKGFDSESDTEKAIILITDGEDTAQGSEALTELAQTLAKEKIRVFAIGVGDPAGAPIPRKEGGFEKDSRGNIMLSKVDETLLKKITAMTGGRYVRSVAGDMDLELIYTKDILETMERRGLTQGKKKVWAQRFQWVLVPALLFLLLELMLANRPASAKSGGDPRMLMGILVFALAAGMVLPGPARAGLFSSPVKEGMAAWEKKDYQKAQKAFIDAQLARPEELRLYYNIGAAAYGAGEYDLAETNFLQASRSRDKVLRKNALYNLANTRYRQGNLEQSVTDFETLLKEFPEDTQAKENLEFVKKKLEEQKEQEQKKQAGDKDSGKKDQNEKDRNNQGQSQDQGQDQDQDNQNRDKQNKGNQDRNKQNQAEQVSKKPGQDSSRGNTKPTGGEKNPPEGKQQNPAGPPPEPKNQEKEQGGDNAQDAAHPKAGPGQASQGEKEKRPGQPGATLLENKLNRLEDKPGMGGVIQSGGPSKIEKDW
ncbi:MAG: VWA domain-containing protein [Desulfobacter sp.]|nr:MAG: VWA domain-containing protein [Desulfobacter sp.]